MTTFPGRPKSLGVIGVLVAVAISVLCYHRCMPVLGSIYLQVGCTGDDSPPRGFRMEQLLLDESAFPEGWRAYEWTFNPRERLPAQQVGRSYYRHKCPYSSVVAGHEAYRFVGGARCADIAYRSRIPVWFARMEGWGPWSVPSELRYQSAIADQFQFACRAAQDSSVQACQFVGQYEEYVVVFETFISRDCMTLGDLGWILVGVDERMAFYLAKDVE